MVATVGSLAHSLHRHQRTDRRMRPQGGRLGERHFDATQTLWKSVRRANETVQRVSAVEVGHPWNASVVIGLAVGEESRHGGGRKSQVHRIGAVNSWCGIDAGVDERREGYFAVLEEF